MEPALGVKMNSLFAASNEALPNRVQPVGSAAPKVDSTKFAVVPYAIWSASIARSSIACWLFAEPVRAAKANCHVLFAAAT